MSQCDPLGLAGWVQSQLRLPFPKRTRKAVHDTVLGTDILAPYEVALLDTPLMQRLRYVHQTGMTYFVFPSARHSRFEHSLGTVALVKRYVAALNRRPGSAASIEEAEIPELRLAALLHDCGHGFFSHASEAIFNDLDILRRFRESNPNLAQKGAAELLSYAIVTSGPFQAFFEQLCSEYKEELRGADVSLERIAGYIIGQAPRGMAYKADIISGPYDVDKLDYVYRDAHGTGLRLVVDLDRFFYAVGVVWISQAGSSDERRLALWFVEPLEQLIFSKMMLFATVYHHQKVKACDCLLKGAVDWGRKNNHPVLNPVSPVDFLRLTDSDVLSLTNHPLIHRLRGRDLLYRVVEISTDTVEGLAEGLAEGMHSLRKTVDNSNSLRGLNQAIYDAVPPSARSAVLPEEIWVDVPKLPELNELALGLIARQVGTKTELRTADEIFPTRGWLNGYATFRHRGHVFAPRSVCPDKVFLAVADLLAERPYSIRLKRDIVRGKCHW